MTEPEKQNTETKPKKKKNPILVATVVKQPKTDRPDDQTKGEDKPTPPENPKKERKPRTVEVKHPSLKEKLLSIMEGVPGIKKDGYNSHDKYKYPTDKNIKEHMHDLFIKNRVLLRISSCDGHHHNENSRMAEHLPPSPQNKYGNVHVRLQVIFQDVDSQESIYVYSEGEGMDRGDKGLAIAVTGALKQCLITNFLIPAGDDGKRYSDAPFTAPEKPAEPSKVKEPTPTPSDTQTPVQSNLVIETPRESSVEAQFQKLLKEKLISDDDLEKWRMAVMPDSKLGERVMKSALERPQMFADSINNILDKEPVVTEGDNIPE